MSILEVNSLKKIYTTRFGGNKVEALKNVSFSVEEGEYVAIMGESGSGKTTLSNILAALDKPTSGVVSLDGQNLSKIKESAVSAFRRDNLGFVFQDFNLLDTFSIEDNIYLPLVLAGKNPSQMERRLVPIAGQLGITGILRKYPYEVSGGQKQRAAVARALITEPRLILADEPTGALDSKSTDELLSLFSEINRNGQTILMVTHSVKAASHAGRVLFIKDGEVFHQLYRGNNTNQQLYQKISDTLTMLATGGDRLLTCVGMVMMFYVVSFLSECPVLEEMRGGMTLQSMLSFGSWVIGAFALIFLFYTNSFLIRRRKKEFGLYNILGMGKGNLARILLWESLIVAGIALIAGLFFGILLSKLAELGMVNLVNGDITFSLSLGPDAILRTLLLFAVIFLLLLLNALRQIHLTNPIELIHSENAGERPPKANWFLALAGIVILGAAYFIAVTIELLW